MSKLRRHRVKQENAAASSSNTRLPEEHDLAYFIHDRVELMHQIFSVLKSKELKALAPECVRRLSTDDLQELCLEELLGISSKRLCAILDGAEPPSDTESSSQSPDRLETISLDSISSDEEILSQGSGKKKKHKHRHGKKKRKKRAESEEAGETRASRAGLTVLELLELQARARAIRAQLHQEHKAPSAQAHEPASDNEVEIKEEPAEVVEISSDEDKPDVARLQKEIAASKSNTNGSTAVESNKDESQPVTKRINDLIITVPQAKPTRKIKLKRQKPTENVVREETVTKVPEKEVDNNEVKAKVSNDNEQAVKIDNNEANKSKKRKKKKKKAKDNEGSDGDEITLQLSDTEKMDLLEDLDAKNLDNVSSSDSDSSDNQQNTEKPEVGSDDSKKQEDNKQTDEKENDKTNDSNENDDVVVNIIKEKNGETNNLGEIKGYVSNDNGGTVEINDLTIIVDDVIEAKDNVMNSDEADLNSNDKQVDVNKKTDLPDESNDSSRNNEKNEHEKSVNQKSDGEISDRDSSEVEVSDVQSEVVCISEDESKKKKKKKKEKKSKKDKNKSGFQEAKNDNFYKEDKVEDSNSAIEVTIDIDDDDVYEILEISDDSSCYEVEGVSVLSKEPTAEEIEAFSARMDEIKIDSNERVITTEKEDTTLSETCDVENVSWKDRYLGSKKVKRVLTTSNILNAIRKKNIELKKKLEESKKAEKVEIEKERTTIVLEKVAAVEDGSVEQYETLQGSTKYVDPVKEKEADDKEKEGEAGTEGNETVSKDVKKDAKMLLKMYRRLLKYNDINKQKDPNKKKKKKKKSKDKDKVNTV